MNQVVSNIKTLNKYRWAGHVRPTVICVHCGKPFIVSPSTVKRGKKYCSRACYNQNRTGLTSGDKHYNWKGGEITKSCIVCKNDFHARRDQIRRTGAKFCSYNCRSIYNVRYNHGSQNTDIENIIESSLLRLNIPHKKQVAIDGIALVDFLLPGKNIIQCDGDYWHSLPETKERDVRQDASLSLNGYTVLRLRGSAIKKNLPDCEAVILAFTNKGNQ